MRSLSRPQGQPSKVCRWSRIRSATEKPSDCADRNEIVIGTDDRRREGLQRPGAQQEDPAVAVPMKSSSPTTTTESPVDGTVPRAAASPDKMRSDAVPNIVVVAVHTPLA